MTTKKVVHSALSTGRIQLRTLKFLSWKKKVTDEQKDCQPKDLKDTVHQTSSEGNTCEAVKLEGRPKPKVIIIGAGMAGLSAAMRLIQTGIQSLVILEATDRIGGRVRSTWFGDSTVELGPLFIEGASIANPVYNLANTSGAITAPVQRFEYPRTSFFTSDGRTLQNFQVEEMMFNQLLKDAKAGAPSAKKTPGTLLQYLSLRIQQEVMNLPENRRYDAERILYGLVNELKVISGTELDNMSGINLKEKVNIPGGRVVLPGGMQNLFLLMIREIKDDQIKLNTPVHEIVKAKNPKLGNRVMVRTCEGECFCGDFVICTVPLAVLKKSWKTMFKDCLSDQRITAIESLGVGHKENIYFAYNNPWWIHGETNLKLAWSMDEMTNRQDWMKGIGSIFEVPNSSSIIAVTMGGAESLMLDGVSAEEVAIEFTKFLRSFIGDPTLPYPSNILMSNWSCEPYAGGATVYMSKTTTPGMFKDLGGDPCEDNATGLVPPILFAGDSTIAKLFGTLEGARISGAREANRIIKAAERGHLAEEYGDDSCDSCQEACSSN